jgi:hypothetical protein
MVWRDRRQLTSTGEPCDLENELTGAWEESLKLPFRGFWARLRWSGNGEIILGIVLAVFVMGRVNFSASAGMRKEARRRIQVEIIMTCKRRDTNFDRRENNLWEGSWADKSRETFWEGHLCKLQRGLLPGDHDDSRVGGCGTGECWFDDSLEAWDVTRGKLLTWTYEPRNVSERLQTFTHLEYTPP